VQIALDYKLFHWFCQKVTAAIPVGQPVIKAEAKTLNFHVLKGWFIVSVGYILLRAGQ
jgi:hypothetical protein